MAAVWMRFRAELRARWGALLALVLLVGLAGGATLAATAGARRTSSAYSRLERATQTRDVLVNPDNGTDSALDDHAVAALPQVRSAGRVDGLFVVPAHIRSFADFGALGVVLASDGRVGYDFARPRLDHGRMPERGAPNEVWIDRDLAQQQGLRVGDRFPVVALEAGDVATLEDTDESQASGVLRALRRGEIGHRVRTRVVGIGEFPEDIVVDEGFEAQGMVFGPAFLKANPDVGIGYWGALARLRRGPADLSAFRMGVEALVPGEAVAFQSRTSSATKAERAVRPAVGALTAFAVVIGLTSLLIVGQALARQTFLDAVDNEVLRALGSTRRQLFAAAMLRSATIGVLGGLVAVAVAVVASPLSPIGTARRMEPDPGVAFDGPVLGVGLVAVVGAVLLLAAVPAWQVARSRGGGERDARPSRAAAVATAAGLPVPAVAGVRMALEPGRGRTAVPVRTTIFSAGLAIATVIAALVFATSLDHLVSTPRLFGWNWDSQISVNAQQAQATPGVSARDEVARLLDRSPAVSRWGTVSLTDVALDGAPMPAVGIDPGRNNAVPTVVSGRLPSRRGEIALGRLTQRRLGVGPGDRVRARDLEGATVPLRVVGTVVLPGLGTYQGSDKTSLGEGAVLTRAQLYRLGPDFHRDDFVVQFAQAATPAARRAVVDEARAVAEAVDPEGFDAAGVQRPSDIVAYDRVRSTPLVLALVLGVLAFATVAHGLVSAVRRRRRDLAMLATLGLTRRQVSATVAWQATTVGACALVIGLPLGIIGGRWAWGFLADDLGTLSEPQVPLAWVALAVPAVLLLCNLVAYVPGRLAARIRPAAVLRSE